MSISYRIKRFRCRRFTPVQAATMAFLLAAAIIAGATAIAAATGTVYEEDAVIVLPAGQCWTSGCARTVV